MTISRRRFIKTAAAAGAFTIVPRFVLGNGYTPPSDRINIGFIGLGKQCPGLAKSVLQQDGAQIVAGSDVWTTKTAWFHEQVAGIYAEDRGMADYRGIETYLDYRDLLDREDIDAVVVATPDHWHAIQSIDAMEAGKDLFCEKPLTRTVQEGRALVTAAESTGRVVQTGCMQRSWENFRRACELVRNGYLGDIFRVEVNVGDPPRAYDLPAEELPPEIGWNAWCGPAPLLPYNHRLAPSRNDVKFWPDWRLYREFGGGILADWGAHMFDIAQWALDMDHTGPVEFTPPDDPAAVRGLRMKYASGVEMVHRDFGRGWAVRFLGSEGTVDISRKFFESNPSGLADVEPKPGDQRLRDTGGNHVGDWLDAVRNRSEPLCPAETGHRSASVCNLANIAYRLNRPLRWDPDKEVFIGDDEANELTGGTDRVWAFRR